MNSSLKSWSIALVGGLFFFYNFFQMTLFNPLAPALMEHFGLNGVAFGSINSGFFLAVALLALPGGMIADKVRTKPLLLALTLLTVINLWITASTSSEALLAVMRFIQGMTHAFALTLPMKLVVQWIAPKRMAMASSLIVTIGLLGGALSQPIMTYFLTQSGLHQALLNDAYIGLGIFALFFLVVQDNKSFWEKHESPSWFNYFQGSLVSILNPQNWMGGIYVCMLNLPLILLGATWGQLYMEHTWSLKGESGSFVISLIFFGVIAGGPLLGFLSDAVRSRKLVLVAGSIASLIVLGAILLLPSISPLMLGILFFVLGITISSQVLVYPMVAESNPPNYVGTSMSIVTLVMMAGNALANVLFSALIKSQTIETAWGAEYSAETFKPGMWMMWAAILASLFIIALMRETFKKTS